MATVTNKLPALVHLAGVQLIPEVETPVPDEALESKAVKQMVEQKMLEVSDAPDPAKSTTTVPVTVVAKPAKP